MGEVGGRERRMFRVPGRDSRHEGASHKQLPCVMGIILLQQVGNARR